MEELDQLLERAASDAAARPAFLAALLAADVYVLGSLDPPPVQGVAQPGATASIAAWSDADGQITPFFTSETALQATLRARPGTDPAFIRLPARTFLEMLRGQRLALNPDGYGKVFLPDEVAALLDGREPGVQTTVVQRDQQVLVGAPARVPPDLLRVLRTFFGGKPAVERVHLGWIVNPAEGQDGHYLVVIVSADPDAAMRGFGGVQVGDVADGRAVDVIVARPGERHLLSDLAPIYLRPGGLGRTINGLLGRS